MSFVTALRDYVDILSSTPSFLTANLTFQDFITETFLYLLQSIKLAFIYLITGQWIRDLVFLPIKAPEISISVIKEGYVPSFSPFSNILTFSESFEKDWNPFLFFVIGFLNSFFASLPFSSAHLLMGRRLLVQGIPAGLAAGLGTLTGQFFFLTCIIFGLRPLVIPWVSFQPWTAFLSFGILIYLVYGISQARSFQMVKSSDFASLGRFFVINFLLSWCEQTAFFHHLGNVTFYPSGSFLESFSLSTGILSFLAHSNYLIGFLLGGCFFGIGFVFGTLFLRDLFLKWTNLSISKFIQRINFWFMSSLLALSLCTFPFYGIDFLFGKPLGILPQERSLHGTVISPNKMIDLEWFLSQNKVLFSKQSDLTPWDTGLYIQFPGKVETTEESKAEENPFLVQSIEELNIGADYALATPMKRMPAPQRQGSRSLGKWLRDLFSQDQARDGGDGQKSEKLKTSYQNSTEKSQIFNSPKSNSPEENILSISDTKGGKIWSPFLNEDRFFKEDEFLEDDDFNERNRISMFKTRANEDIEIDSQLFESTRLSLSPFFDYDLNELEPIQQIIEKRFYQTSAYKRALDFDIDLFVSRQPKESILSHQEEVELLEKRQALYKYYDTLRSYNEMEDSSLFNQFFGGSKSYASKFYNQQFKGTLRIVRKLFSIQLDNEKESSPLIFDQPLFLNKNKEIPFSHEELLKRNENKKSLKSLKTPFLKSASSRPLYAGWDEQSKKLVLTNRSLSRSLVGQQILISEEMRNQYPTLKGILSSKRFLTFTSWPMPKKVFLERKDVDNLPKNYNLMYQISPMEDDTEEEREKREQWPMGTTPRNYGPAPAINPAEYVWKIVPPNRGGIIWPGSNKIILDFKEFLKGQS
jgi:hypothetical protein